MESPMVTLVTPTTYSRVKFGKLMVSNILTQTYPHDKLTWLVVGDDLPETKVAFESIFKHLQGIKCRYVPCDIKGDIGGKRNFAVSQATTKIIANLDDDDLYMKSYVEYSIKELKRTKSGIVGCRDMLIFFPECDGKMVYLKGISIHEATMVCTKSHWKTNKYHDGVMKGEGTKMVNGRYNNELNIREVMICLAHGENTYDKSRFLKSPQVEISESIKKNLINMING